MFEKTIRTYKVCQDINAEIVNTEAQLRYYLVKQETSNENYYDKIEEIKNQLRAWKVQREKIKEEINKLKKNKTTKEKVAERVILEGKTDLKLLSEELNLGYKYLANVKTNINRELEKMNIEDGP